MPNKVDWSRGPRVNNAAIDARGPMFWRDETLPFIEARSVQDGRQVRYARHWHQTFSIGLISRGRCNYISGTQSTEACVGTVVLMNPGDVHACNPVQGEPWSYRMLYIDVPWLRETQGFTPFAAISTTQPELYSGLNQLFDTLIDPQREPLQKETAAISFMGLVNLRLGASRPTQGKKTPRLRHAAEFIRQNCTRSLRLDEICAVANLSPSHLIRAFKEVHGLTPHAYQLNCRIEFCRSQLRAGHPIADVALGAGFSDQAHFQRSFKKFVAATPGQYRA